MPQKNLYALDMPTAAKFHTAIAKIQALARLARNWAEWEAAMRSQQLPIFNTCYADQDGHIAYIYNAALPVHPEGDYEFWKGVVPGDRSDLIATEIQPWEAVPKTIGRCLSSLFISRIFFDS